jgi:dienelactone hydrolase
VEWKEEITVYFLRFFLMLPVLVACANAPLASENQPVTLQLATIQRAFIVSAYQIPGTAPRPAVLIMGGAKGYKASAYAHLAATLNLSGIDVFFIHYLTNEDFATIESAGSAGARIAFYSRRMADWLATIDRTLHEIRRQPRYQSEIGILGISLGAMPTAAFGANNPDVAAMALVDGGFPANFRTRIDSMPPLVLVWGSEDQVFPQSVATKLSGLAHKLGSLVELFIYPGEGHAFFLQDGNANAIDADAKIANFFKINLKPQR